MDESCTPKQLLFGELLKKQSFHGTKKRWSDEIVGDLYTIGVGDEWLQLCQNGRRYIPVLLTFLHSTEEQLLVLLRFFSNLETF